MALQKGDTAPLFTLYDTEKNKVSLESYSGQNVLVLFFPLAFTGTCTEELCSIRDDIAAYEDLSTQVLAISVDSPHTLTRFKEEQRLNFPLLSDFNKEVSAAYGSQYEEFVLEMKKVAKRSAFVVDSEGKILYAEVLEEAGDLPNFDAVITALCTTC
ncbi:MAG TPA: redoxin domain-containing protein [Flavobacteriales bacterium]|nr:redoxin domain-containing protein [Flavobacteriales bacterium]